MPSIVPSRFSSAEAPGSSGGEAFLRGMVNLVFHLNLSLIDRQRGHCPGGDLPALTPARKRDNFLSDEIHQGPAQQPALRTVLLLAPGPGILPDDAPVPGDVLEQHPAFLLVLRAAQPDLAPAPDDRPDRAGRSG